MSVWISKFKANNQTNKKCQHIESLHGPAIATWTFPFIGARFAVFTLQDS